LASASLTPRLAPTSAPGDATRIVAEEIGKGADLILALGGDGTVNEVMNGMLGSRVPLGILPAGTANVLSMELGFGSRLGRAIGLLATAVERRVAIGKLVNGSVRYFLAMGGVGLDAKIVYDLNPTLKAMTGKLAYWLGGFGHVGEPVQNFDVRINGDSYRCGFALVSRVRNYGGDLEIARGASLLSDDFEVVMFEGSDPLRYLGYMTGVMLRQVQNMPGVRTVRAREIDLSGAAHVQIDGEYAGRIPARFEIVPDALTILAPPVYR
jgi:diacylglycerol kinase (ATP)